MLLKLFPFLIYSSDLQLWWVCKKVCVYPIFFGNNRCELLIWYYYRNLQVLYVLLMYGKGVTYYDEGSVDFWGVIVSQLKITFAKVGRSGMVCAILRLFCQGYGCYLLYLSYYFLSWWSIISVVNRYWCSTNVDLRPKSRTGCWFCH